MEKLGNRKQKSPKGKPVINMVGGGVAIRRRRQPVFGFNGLLALRRRTKKGQEHGHLVDYLARPQEWLKLIKKKI